MLGKPLGFDFGDKEGLERRCLCKWEFGSASRLCTRQACGGQRRRVTAPWEQAQAAGVNMDCLCSLVVPQGWRMRRLED